MKWVATTALVLAVAWSAPVRAQERPRADTSSAQRPSDQNVPENLHIDTRDGVLIAGLATFGAAYWAALYVGATSDIMSDHLMLIPLAGPWISLADRDDCGAKRAPPCGPNGTYRALIVTDGIVQAAGAILALSSFLIPKSKTATPAPSTPEVHVSVSPTNTGGWLTAVGHF